MRKLITALVILVLVASAGAYYIYQPFSKAASMAAEAVLPGDTLTMVRVCELKQQIDRFRSGQMGQALDRIDWPNLLAAMGVAEFQRLQFVRTLEDIETGVDSVWFDILFGQDISLAILDADIDTVRLEGGDMTQVLDSFVLVARPSQPTRVLESLNSMLGIQLSVETEAYEQWEINRLSMGDGLPFYYALTDGLMIAGFSGEPVKTCLRQSLDGATCLLRSERYRKHCADLYEAGRTEMIVFSDIGEIRTLALNAIDAMEETTAEDMQLKMQLEIMQGMESLNFVQYDDGGPMTSSRMIVGLDRENLSSYMRRALDQAPETNPTLSRVPADALLYSWQNTLDPMLYWENMQNDPGMLPESLAEIRQSVAEATGMSLEDLLSAFGTQVGVLLNDINMGGMFPVPEFALFAEVTKPEVIETLIGRMMARSGMAVQQDAFGDTDIHYVTLPLGGNMSPAYAISDGIFTLAMNRSLLKSILNTSDTAHLESNPHFKSFGSGMTSDNNSVFYLGIEDFTEKTREVLSWAMTWMAMVQPDKASNMQQIKTLGIDPLLEGFSMIKAMGGRAYTEEDRIVSEIQVLLDRSL